MALYKFIYLLTYLLTYMSAYICTVRVVYIFLSTFYGEYSLSIRLFPVESTCKPSMKWMDMITVTPFINVIL